MTKDLNAFLAKVEESIIQETMEEKLSLTKLDSDIKDISSTSELETSFKEHKATEYFVSQMKVPYH